MDAKEIKKKIDSLKKLHRKTESLIERQEEDEIYDESLYNSLDKIDTEIEELELMLN